MSPPSPAFSLDSSSPFANGLHFESILFEDEEEDEDTGLRSSSKKQCSSSVRDIATFTNPRHHGLSKGKRKTKARVSVKQDEKPKEKSDADCDPASLECRRQDATTASLRSVLLLLCNY